jgi:hypothetical protein
VKLRFIVGATSLHQLQTEFEANGSDPKPTRKHLTVSILTRSGQHGGQKMF